MGDYQHAGRSCRPVGEGTEGQILACYDCKQEWKYTNGKWRGLRGKPKPTRRERKSS